MEIMSCLDGFRANGLLNNYKSNSWVPGILRVPMDKFRKKSYQ